MANFKKELNMKKFLLPAVLTFVSALKAASIENLLPHEFWQNPEISKPVLTEALEYGSKMTANIDCFPASMRDLKVSKFICEFTYCKILEKFTAQGIRIPTKSEFIKSVGIREDLANGSLGALYEFLKIIGNIVGKEEAQKIYPGMWILDAPFLN